MVSTRSSNATALWILLGWLIASSATIVAAEQATTAAVPPPKGIAAAHAPHMAARSKDNAAATHDGKLKARSVGSRPRKAQRALAADTRPPAEPVMLTIPALDVHAHIVSVTVTDGVLVPPGDPQQIGWWDGSARVGARRGATVLTGHTVHTGGGALDHLAQLRRDNRISVRTARGEIGYRVSSMTIYSKRSLAAEAATIFDQSTAGRLVLITCDGWNGSGYDNNAVVVARPDAAAVPD